MFQRFSAVGLMLGGVLLLAACGSSDGGAVGVDPENGVGTVVAPWTDFCTGTFIEDVEILNHFFEPAFTARAGEEYLMGSPTRWLGTDYQFFPIQGVVEPD